VTLNWLKTAIHMDNERRADSEQPAGGSNANDSEGRSQQGPDFGDRTFLEQLSAATERAIGATLGRIEKDRDDRTEEMLQAFNKLRSR